MPLTADERIILIRIKIERAKKHLRALAEDVLAIERRTVVIANVQRGPASFRQGFPDTDTFLNVPRFSAEVLAEVSDIVHNLRTALDHLMCHLLSVAGSRITTRDSFPISGALDRYQLRRAEIVNRVGPGVIEAIDRLKPYKGGNDTLWRIHELDRIDKHRALFTFAHDFVFHADWLSDDFLFKKNAPDFVGLYDQQVEQDMQFEIEKSLGNPLVAGGDAILPSVHQMVDSVEALVLGFKQFLG